MTLYANTDSQTVGTGGGTIGTVSLGADAMTQLTGTSTPCRVVYLSAIGTTVHWATASVTISCGALLNSVCPTVVPIDDASKIWLSSEAVASVYATYLY